MGPENAGGYGPPTSSGPPARNSKRRTAMKIIASALLALSMLTGIAASANAIDAKSFYETLDRSSN
jgi:hypothetical protein